MRRLMWLIVLMCGSVNAETQLCWANSNTWQPCVGATVWNRATVGGYGEYDGGTFSAFDALPDTRAVYVCEADRPIGAGSGCPAGSYTQERFVLKSTLAQTEPPEPPPSVAFEPACIPLPNLRGEVIDVPADVSTRWNKIGVWSCAQPNSLGQVNHYWFFSWGNAVGEIRRTWTVAEATAAFNARSQPLTDVERAFASTVMEQYGSRALVSLNGTAATRPVYALRADGTRNTTAVANARVAVGERCRLGKRLGSTSYYSVEGRDNLATADPADVLGAVYAVCTRSDPLGLN